VTFRRLLLSALLVLPALGAVGISFAAFSSTTTNPGSSFSAKRVFPGVRSIAANDIRDASAGGAEVNAADPFTAAADGRTSTTSNWSNAFAANRWVEYDLNSPLPSGLAVSSPQFEFRFAATSAARTGCFYFEVYLRSTSTLIGTHGSSGSPVGCVTGTTQTTFSTPIAEVTSTTIANDLRIRVYGRDTASRAMVIDLATVTGSTPYSSFTLNETAFRDQADTTLSTTNWSIAAADLDDYRSAATWANAYSAARYLKFATDLFVPAGGTISSADFVYSYRPNTNGHNICWFFETYNGAALLAAHGSSGAPISCDSTSADLTTDTVAIPEVTVADLNNLVIRVYHWRAGGGTGRSWTDFVRLDVNYHLN
jgi:hypothetical protein